VRALVSPAARAIFSTWTKGPVRYRVAWSKGGHRRAAVWSIAQRVQEIDKALVNDPTDTTWEARVVEIPDEAPHTVEVILVPRAIEDPRFLYRERDVPAASHPTIAAALARIAGVRADDVVWDPFVGSGTELVERARLGPYAELHGSDRDPNALEAARTNLRAARVEASLVHADALKHAPSGVTLILTNPPMGRRVLKRSEAGDLAEQMVSRASEVLQPGGRLVWISPAVGRTERRAKNVGLVVEMNHDVDMGGFTAAIQVLRRPAQTQTAPGFDPRTKPKGMR
jgi:precorrin-6B methylase 2